MLGDERKGGKGQTKGEQGRTQRAFSDEVAGERKRKGGDEKKNERDALGNDMFSDVHLEGREGKRKGAKKKGKKKRGAPTLARRTYRLRRVVRYSKGKGNCERQKREGKCTDGAVYHSEEGKTRKKKREGENHWPSARVWMQSRHFLVESG